MKKILAILCMLGILSCDSYLDLKPKGFTIPEYYDDYWKLMNYAQLYKADESWTPLLTDDAQLSSGDSVNNFQAKSESDRRAYSFQHGPIFEDGVRDGLWEFSYNRIYTFNTVINNIMDVPDATEEKKLTLRAEALVARAFEYLTLIAVYAKAYDPATAETDYGVPIITSEDVGDLNYRRNTVAEVYAKIQEDLETALPHLEDRVSHSFRPAKNVGYAFLARMYLHMGNYEKTLENAVKAVEIDTSLVSLLDYGIGPGNLQIGRIRKLPELTTPYPEGMDNPENIYARYAPYVFGLSRAVYASNDLLKVYDKDLQPGQVDKRRELWYSDDSFNTLHFPGRTLFVAYIRANLGLNNMDVLLTAAEAHVRVGGNAGLAQAEILYNHLRRHRITNYKDIKFTNADDALVKILDERRREFAFLGSYRLIDLKRLNKEPRFQKTIVHTADGQTWTLPPNDNRYILPLPPKVIAFRPDLPDYER